MQAEPQHLPVMLEECLYHLALPAGGGVVDGTVGLGGHAVRLLEAVGPAGRLLGLDRDPHALNLAEERLCAAAETWGWSNFPVRTHRTDFRHLAEALRELDVAEVDGVLLDLGVSSMQLDQGERGFSFRRDGPLDMRMDPNAPVSASTLVNELPETELASILWELGEERYSRRIAKRIVQDRKARPFQTTLQLADVIRSCFPTAERHGRIHPATRSFQALRIAVNEELEALEPAITAAVEHLKPGGRLVVLSYHSLEDRIVKRTLEYLSGRCRCDPDLPVCRCGATELVRLVTRKPLEPTPAEVSANPRARSARLRAAERL
jgi:16S rRNA (cytosine1402-N4)-methyltransferase